MTTGMPTAKSTYTERGVESPLDRAATISRTRSIALGAVTGAIALLLPLFLTGYAFAAPDAAARAELQKDQPGAKDFAPAGRYQGAHLLAQTVNAFDELTLPSGPTTTDAAQPKPHFKNTVTARGQVTRSLYVAPPGRSTLEILVNHENALKAAGYKIVFECAGNACGDSFASTKFVGDRPDTRIAVAKASQTRKYLADAMLEYVKDVRYALLQKGTADNATYVGVYLAQMTGGSHGDSSEALTGYEGVLIEAVEPKAMEQRIVTVTSNEIDANLASQGRAVFYGLYFDFNKADIKPESGPQLAEMAKFLTTHPSSKVFVVGHTDNQGKLDYNIALSLKRAQAVVGALQSHYRISAQRMVARGCGPLAPIAENRDDAGRAKNRRVELVEQGS